MTIWTNDTGVTVYVISNTTGFGAAKWEATVADGGTFNDDNITLADATKLGFVTQASLENQQGGGATMSSYMGGGVGTTKNFGFSAGLIAYPGSGQYYTFGSYSGTVNMSDGSSAGGGTALASSVTGSLGVASGSISAGGTSTDPSAVLEVPANSLSSNTTLTVDTSPSYMSKASALELLRDAGHDASIISDIVSSVSYTHLTLPTILLV